MKKYTLLKKNVNNDRSKDSPAILMLFYYRWIRGGGGESKFLKKTVIARRGGVS